MTKTDKRSILRALKAAQLITWPLAADDMLALIPAKFTAVTVVNATGFNPHEKRAEVRVARPVILSFDGAPYGEMEADWRAIGAVSLAPRNLGELAAMLEDGLGYDIFGSESEEVEGMPV